MLPYKITLVFGEKLDKEDARAESLWQALMKKVKKNSKKKACFGKCWHASQVKLLLLPLETQAKSRSYWWNLPRLSLTIILEYQKTFVKLKVVQFLQMEAIAFKWSSKQRYSILKIIDHRICVALEMSLRLIFSVKGILGYWRKVLDIFCFNKYIDRNNQICW